MAVQFPNLGSQYPSLPNVAGLMPGNMSNYAYAITTEGTFRVLPGIAFIPVPVLWGKRRGVAVMLAGPIPSIG